VKGPGERAGFYVVGANVAGRGCISSLVRSEDEQIFEDAAGVVIAPGGSTWDRDPGLLLDLHGHECQERIDSPVRASERLQEMSLANSKRRSVYLCFPKLMPRSVISLLLARRRGSRLLFPWRHRARRSICFGHDVDQAVGYERIEKNICRRRQWEIARRLSVCLRSSD